MPLVTSWMCDVNGNCAATGISYATTSPASTTPPVFVTDVGNVPLGLALLIFLVGFLCSAVLWDLVVRRKL